VVFVKPHGLLFLGVYPYRPVVVLYNYAATTDASLINPRVDILAKVLPFIF